MRDHGHFGLQSDPALFSVGLGRVMSAIAISFPPPSNFRLPTVQENSIPQNDFSLYSARSQQPVDQLRKAAREEAIALHGEPLIKAPGSGNGDGGHRDRRYPQSSKRGGKGQRSAPAGHNPFEQKIPTLWSRRSSWMMTTRTRMAPF